jgi:restriction system protein
MPDNSLFAILLRSSWWISFAIAAGVLLVARMLLPEKYFVAGAMIALPFFGIGLYTGWRQLRAPSASRVAADLEAIEAMSWRTFSGALEEALRRDGYVTRALKEGAADFELTRAGRTSLLCGKRWKAASTGVEWLRELDTLKIAREADEAVYVAIGGITDNARRYAAEQGMRLIEGAALAQLMRGALARK